MSWLGFRMVAVGSSGDLPPRLDFWHLADVGAIDLRILEKPNHSASRGRATCWQRIPCLVDELDPAPIGGVPILPELEQRPILPIVSTLHDDGMTPHGEACRTTDTRMPETFDGI